MADELVLNAATGKAHTPGCHYLEGADPDVLTDWNPPHGGSGGESPCRVCLPDGFPDSDAEAGPPQPDVP